VAGQVHRYQVIRAALRCPAEGTQFIAQLRLRRAAAASHRQVDVAELPSQQPGDPRHILDKLRPVKVLASGIPADRGREQEPAPARQTGHIRPLP
jgi:hypothetical protein